MIKNDYQSSVAVLEQIAQNQLKTMPGVFLPHIAGLIIQVVERPDRQTLAELGIESADDLLGLYRGTPVGDKSIMLSATDVDMVYLYHGPLIQYQADTGEDLGHLVRHVLIHEIGHHFGFSDDDMERIEKIESSSATNSANIQSRAGCPVCGGAAKPVMDLSHTRARQQISALFGEPLPAEITFSDYTMMECEKCSLVFANPMVAGGAEYYGWITSRPGYSAGQRWEWGKIANILAGYLSPHHGPLKVLEVGCGNGILMEYLSHNLNKNNNFTICGIDVSAPSVSLAKQKGLDARQVDLTNPDDALSKTLGDDEMFDGIILSHVLEHVSDPLAVARALSTRLTSGGSMFVSVPYSPMSRELDGWDIQNLPPHHLTRWNNNSLEMLASELGLKLHLQTAKAKSPFKRAVQDTCGRAYGNSHPSILKRLIAVFSNPKMFADFYSRHKGRQTLGGPGGRVVGDTALAVFSRTGG